MLVMLNVLCKLYSHKAGMRTTMVAGRKTLSKNARNFMFLGVIAVVNDAVNARMLYLVAGLVSLLSHCNYLLGLSQSP